MNICVVGAGYVGLVTGAVFADLGNEVVCVDNRRATRSPRSRQGTCRSTSRVSRRWWRATSADGRLSFTTDLAAAVRRSVIVFIAVGTPPKVDGQTDLSAVEAVAREIGRVDGPLPGRGQQVDRPGRHRRSSSARSSSVSQPQPISFDVVSNPEFLREGSAIEDTLRPDRIVIGAPTQQVGHDPAGALRAARAPDDHHRRAVGRDDQVRLERASSRRRSRSSTRSPTSASSRAPTSRRS